MMRADEHTLLSALLTDTTAVLHRDAYVNEVLLLHGTTEKSAAQIARYGFDERLTKRMLYWSGVYFTTEA